MHLQPYKIVVDFKIDRSNMSTYNIIELINTFITPVANFATVGALLFSILQYKKEQEKNRSAQAQSRRDTVNKLISEYRRSEKIQLALKILDDFVVEPLDEKDIVKPKHPPDYYRISNLGSILKDHSKGSITDPGEIAIRDAFDELLDFLGILGYYLSVEVITKQDLSYFEYYIKKLKDNKAVENYANIYGFEGYKQLIDKYK